MGTGKRAGSASLCSRLPDRHQDAASLYLQANNEDSVQPSFPLIHIKGRFQQFLLDGLSSMLKGHVYEQILTLVPRNRRCLFLPTAGLGNAPPGPAAYVSRDLRSRTRAISVGFVY